MADRPVVELMARTAVYHTDLGHEDHLIEVVTSKAPVLEVT